jgi:taurine transport system substrate-binding protein
MKKNLTAAVLATATATVMATTSYAADSVNAAFFLEWASPNQIAKVDKTYDAEMGVDVIWTDFSTGVQMTEAMLAGDIDISYSQGLAPFVTAIQQGAPLKMVAVAMMYEANDCFVKNGLGIDASNASELEGKTVAVPLNTMADFAFKSYMNSLDVDMSTMTIVDQAPADGAVSLADGSVDMACIFGGNSAKAASEVGTPIMTSAQKVDAGIGSFDVVTVTEKFATENPDLLRTFLDVTDEANAAYAKGFSDAQFAKVAKDAGMSVEDTRSQLEGMIFLSEEDQKSKFFGADGVAASAAAALGVVFSDASDGASIAKTIDASFLD